MLKKVLKPIFEENSEMIKILIVTSVIIFSSFNSFSQENNELQLHYGTSDSKLLRNDDLAGAGSNDVKNFTELGFRYLRKISDNFALETGINYTTADLVITPHFMGEPVQQREEDFEFISIPVYLNYTIWNFLFINGGSIIDFQLSENTTDSQSGIGYGLGIGGKYDFDNFFIFLNPKFKRHAVIPFEKENYHQKLTEFGIQFGVGYKF